MAIVSIKSEKVNKIIGIYDREKEVYDKSFLEAKNNNNTNRKKENKNNSLMDKSFIFIFIALGSVAPLTFIFDATVETTNNIIISLIVLTIGLACLSHMRGISVRSKREYQEIEDFNKGFNSKIKKEEYDFLSNIHSKFGMSSQKLAYQPMLDGNYGVRFIDIELLKEKVVKMAFINDDQKQEDVKTNN